MNCGVGSEVKESNRLIIHNWISNKQVPGVPKKFEVMGILCCGRLISVVLSLRIVKRF
jgi:hypothetical protein